MAVTFDFKEAFRCQSCVIHILAELKWNHGILVAMDDQNGSVNFLQPGSSIELPMYKKADAREKPENLAGDSRSRRKRRLEHHTCDPAMCCQVRSNSRAEGLAERDYRFTVDTPCAHKVFVSGIGIAVDPSLARLSLAVAVTAVLQGKDVCMHAAEKFIDGCTVSDVGRIAVKDEKSKFRFVVSNPPCVKFDAIGRLEPDIFNIQIARMPVAVEAVGIIREEDQARFEDPGEQQRQEVADKDREKVAQETTVKRPF